MPLIVDASATPLPPPEVVTSPDGVLSVTRDEQWAGVELVFDFTALGASPLIAEVAATDSGVLLVTESPVASQESPSVLAVSDSSQSVSTDSSGSVLIVTL